MAAASKAPEDTKPPASRLRVTLTVLFHSSCAILSTILSKSALNGVDAPVTLLALQTFVQVLLLTTIGSFTGLVELHRSLAVPSPAHLHHNPALTNVHRLGKLSSHSQSLGS